MNQSELEAKTCDRRQARENACKQVVIGLSFTSNWSRKWREIFYPITERSKAKPLPVSSFLTLSHVFLACRQLYVFAMRSDWFIALFAIPVIELSTDFNVYQCTWRVVF